MIYADFCNELIQVLDTLRSRYRDRVRLDATFDWDVNWIMKTCRIGNLLLQGQIESVLEENPDDDMAYADAEKRLQNYEFIDHPAIQENCNDVALAKLDKLKRAMIIAVQEREVPTADQLDF